MNFFSGTIENKSGFDPIEKIRLTFLEKGYPVERIDHALVIKIGSFSQFVFQTMPGRIQWESVIVKINDGSISYRFVYRAWLQITFNMVATMIAFFALSKAKEMSLRSFLGTLCLINLMALVVSLLNAQHARHYILKAIRAAV